MSEENPNKDQEEFWSKAGGLKWSESDALLDATFKDVLDHLLEVAALEPGETVLDIGCGTGLSTIRAAQAVGPTGSATGADIADQMLVRAREQAAEQDVTNLSFRRADAQTHAFEAGLYDAVISRFGVMFFADPAAAFANIAGAVRPGGRMVFMTWASLPENPWFAMPRDVAVARLGAIEPTPPHAPGPMGLADREYTADVLARAGLKDVTITPLAIDLTPDRNAIEMGVFATKLGPVSRILLEKEGTEADAAAIAETVGQRLMEYETAEGLRIPAAFNRIEARVG